MYDSEKVAEDARNFWKKNRIYEKLMKRRGKKYFVLDGPPYANNIPHVGHIKNTVFKDLIIRLAFMKGNRVLFRPGFDTHGLPIENMVEKNLGLKSKKDIEKFGISNFMKECRKNAALNKDIWMKAYEKLGSLYSLEKPYLTYENYYIESAWWAFSKMYQKKFVYEGEKSVMWCPHCETSLAGYEVTDSYKNVSDPGIYVLSKLKDSDEYLLVYTTTPWTLPSNVAIAIQEKENYATVSCEGKKIILAEKRLKKLDEIGKKYKVLEKFRGEKLVGKKYEPILENLAQKELEKNPKAHTIIRSIPLLKERIASKTAEKKGVKAKDIYEDFVTMDEGTGLVHTAPGHGKTDFLVGQRYDLPRVSPVNERGEFISELAGFSGFVKSADREIVKKLEDEGKLFHHETITHSYPLCWRCKSPLIFRLSKEFFFRVDEIKKIIKRENGKVSWFPDFAKERFENWVDNAEDWNISRNRYWGIPIPLWKCSSCGKEKIIENKKEIEKLSGKKISDLHSVSEIKIKCKCGKEMEKVRGIFDVWFDSGVAPWASLGYPEENRKLFETHFPVDRINEAQDQIRGWFYSLMFCSAGVFEKAPYREVSMVGWVVDSKGNKMSKSAGNFVSAEDALGILGPDMLRYYFCWDIAPYELQKFNAGIAKKEVGKVLNVLWNLQNLAQKGKISNNMENKWIMSRINSLTGEYQKEIDNFNVHTAMRKMSDFILNDLSRNYVQMTREKENSAVIAYCLERILRLLAPIAPFIAEKIWQNLRDKKIAKEESVHLCFWPKPEKGKINIGLEKKFNLVLKIIELGLAERDRAGIGLRWPLAKIVIYAKENRGIKELGETIKAQLNVKKIELKSPSSKGTELGIVLDTKITPELEAEGYAREMSRCVQDFRKKLGLRKEDKIELFIFTDADLRKKLKSREEFLMSRTNSDKIELFSPGDEERFKNKIDFRIKDKRGKMAIIAK